MRSKTKILSAEAEYSFVEIMKVNCRFCSSASPLSEDLDIFPGKITSAENWLVGSVQEQLQLFVMPIRCH